MQMKFQQKVKLNGHGRDGFRAASDIINISINWTDATTTTTTITKHSARSGRLSLTGKIAMLSPTGLKRPEITNTYLHELSIFRCITIDGESQNQYGDRTELR